MEELSPRELAVLIAEDFARTDAELTMRARQALAHRIETGLRTAARHERLACIELCERRHALWTATEDRPDTPPSLRAEARARGNEAAVIADALKARAGHSPT
jgi:hypothetical protein